LNVETIIKKNVSLQIGIKKQKNMGTMFNYQSVADKFGISDNIVKKIVEEIRKEIPNDNMIMELHVLRALKSYANKHKLALT
jgi:hypothetical protein